MADNCKYCGEVHVETICAGFGISSYGVPIQSPMATKDDLDRLESVMKEMAEKLNSIESRIITLDSLHKEK